ncbi:transmembrane protein 160 [Lampris incognitus]|uniref:transmembrane protein 160 n=1 Tax=Lampris incognitus TaxID=2546036 RepID=UPI0024B4F2F8|nr:transmembrane protein 160 [Lampris incognitus]
MAALSLLTRRRLPHVFSQFVRVSRLVRPTPQHGGVPARRLHGAARLRLTEKGAWGKSRAPEQHYQLSELDKADALMLRKSHETGFLSWFRNGLLATGIGVIAFVQSEVGREAAYAFFILGGVCVSFGGASYIGSLFALRRLMLLSLPVVLLHGGVVSSVALFWLCAVSLYIGRLEVEIIHDPEEEDNVEECQECREKGGRQCYCGAHDKRQHVNEDNDNKGQNK